MRKLLLGPDCFAAKIVETRDNVRIIVDEDKEHHPFYVVGPSPASAIRVAIEARKMKKKITH